MLKKVTVIYVLTYMYVFYKYTYIKPPYLELVFTGENGFQDVSALYVNNLMATEVNIDWAC